MKRSLALGLLTLFILVPLCSAQKRGDAKDALLAALSARENKLWDAWKNRQGSVFNEALSPDTVMVGDMGVAGKKDTVQAIASTDCTVTDFSLSDFKVTLYNPSTALLTYKATQHGTCGGTVLPEHVMASSLWIKRGVKWYAAFHQETPASGPSTPGPTQ